MHGQLGERKRVPGHGYRCEDGEGIKLAEQPRPRGRLRRQVPGSIWILSTPEWLVFLQADNEEPLALCAGKR